MAMKRGLGVAGLVMCAGLMACAEGEEFDGDQSLRAAGEQVEFWNFNFTDPGNGMVELSDDDDDDGLPDIIVWCLDGDGEGTDVFDPTSNYELVVSTDENQIFDADGNLACTAYLEGDLYKLRSGLDGEVLLTATQGRYVFWGDVQELPEPGTYDMQYLVYTQLAYDFYGDLLYDGPRWISDVIAYSDVHIHKASPMRKLLIAALYEGICGTEQLPPPGGPAN